MEKVFGEEARVKKAFITGINGQDGSYLTELLLSKDYEVHGIIRRSSVFTTQRIEHLFKNPNLHIYHGDLTDSSNLHTLISKIKPDEIYNLGAQSHVAVSFEIPEYTAEVDAIGTIRLLNAVKELDNYPRFYNAASSELFGGIPGTTPQNETTPFHPRSPYGTAKLYSYWTTVNYREAYNLFACNGILFNHESPRRSETFVTKKITQAVSRIENGKQDILYLGNLYSQRDWGYAAEYTEAMWKMLQQNTPDDYVIATGETHTIKEFVNMAFHEIGINIVWAGGGVEEKGYDPITGKVVVAIDPKYFRPSEVDILCGDYSKAKKILGWKPKTTLDELCKMMINYDRMYTDYGGKK